MGEQLGPEDQSRWYTWNLETEFGRDIDPEAVARNFYDRWHQLDTVAHERTGTPHNRYEFFELYRIQTDKDPHTSRFGSRDEDPALFYLQTPDFAKPILLDINAVHRLRERDTIVIATSLLAEMIAQIQTGEVEVRIKR